MAKKLRRNKFPAIVTSQKPDQPSDLTEPSPKLTSDEIVAILEGYRQEAEYARLSGPNSRDMTWLQNIDLYWNRFDFTRKAPWQSRELLPEFPQYIDRFAAAMRMALAKSERFFTVSADGDGDGDLASVIRKFMIAILRRISRNPTGQPIDFLNWFEESMKMAALSTFSAIVTYKSDGEGGGYTAVDLEDPYNVWLDPTGRGLYRIRRVEMDLNEFMALGALRDDLDRPLYDLDELDNAYATITALMRAEREKRTGTGQWQMGNRRPIVLHEYYCTLIDPEGKVRGKNVLCVVANNRFLVRGPEANPFWHRRDWLVSAPLITVPLAPYGKSYAENFASIARTFNEMTNLILDAIQTSAMKAFVMIPGLLEDPSQAEEGIYPNVLFRGIEGEDPNKILSSVDMGQIGPEPFQVWQVLKKELQEGAAFNEMTLGQSAPKGRTSAAEINTVDSNASSYIRAIASNIETGCLEPLLDLIWKTQIQHLPKHDPEIEAAIGQQWYQAFYAMKEDFAKHKISFVCRGITSLLQKRQLLQDWMQFMQVVGGNPQLSQWFLQTYSPDKLGKLIADLMDVDLSRLEMSDREKQLAEFQQQQQASAQQQQMQQQHQQELEQIKAKAAAQTAGHESAHQEDTRSFAREAQSAILKHGLELRKMQVEHALNPPPPPMAPGAVGPTQGGASAQRNSQPARRPSGQRP